jgi:hypothetical protein
MAMDGDIVIGIGGNVSTHEKPASCGLFYCSMMSL